MAQATSPPGPPEVLDFPSDDFDAFYKRLYVKLVARAVLLGCPRQEAPDLVQDVLMKVWDRWDDIQWPTRSRYVYRMLRNHVIDRWRSTPAEHCELDEGIYYGNRTLESDVELKTMDNIEAARAYKFIRSELSPRARDVLVMTADGYTSIEIADQTGLDVGTVRSHLWRARALLRRYLEGR